MCETSGAINFLGKRQGHAFTLVRQARTLLRVRDQQPANIVALLHDLADNHDLNDLAGCVLVVEGLVRIRRPD